MQKTCEICKSPFEAEKSARRFCSRACGYAGRGKVGPARKPKLAKSCTVCGDAFEVSAHRVGAKYCSKACWNRRGAIARSCRECGQSFTDYRSNGSQFCSKPCYSAWQIKNVRGRRHPSWKGGTSAHYRRGFDWKEQAERARARDGHQCQRCGIHQSALPGKRKRLDVHHIVPYSISRSNHLLNLVSLCRRCHIAVEPSPAEVRTMRRRKTEGYLPLVRGLAV